jgi:membrane protein
MQIPFARHVPLARQLQREVTKDRVTGLAAEIAFFAVLSIFPGLLMVTAALGTLESFVGSDLAAESKRQIIDFLNLILTSEASGAIRAIEELFEEGSGGVLTLASLFALIGLSRAFSVVVGALNLAYGSSEERPWLKRRLVGLMLSLATMAMVMVTMILVVVGPLLGKGPELADLLGLGEAWAFAWSVLRWPVAFLMLVAWATTLFRLAPSKPLPRWRDGLPGGLLTAVLWLVVSLGLNLYLQLAAGANPVFGVLGGGLILLIWLYLLSLALLLGGEANPIIAAYREGKRSPQKKRGATESAFGP